MAALMHPPPRTPSPKIRIHRSQSFDSPSSRISVTPIDDSPYTKSASSLPIARPLPAYDALQAAESALVARTRNFGRANVLLKTKMSDEDMDMDGMSDTSSSGLSSIDSSPTSPNSPNSPFALFTTGSPSLPLAPSPEPYSPEPYSPTSPLLSSPLSNSSKPSILPSSSSLSVEIFQDPTSSMYDPWLVRVVLDMFDIRGLNWMLIAHWVERGWSVRTSSAEVLGILEANGRIRERVWWD